MEFQFIVVLITAPDDESARKIAGTLLEKKLAACVNIVPQIRSLYSWQGKACDEGEVLLVVKSRAELFEKDLIPAVQAVHPYDVPEIIALPILAGSQAYLDWITAETS